MANPTPPGNPNSPQLSYTNFAQYVANTMYAAQLGTVPSIPNALATSSLDTTLLTDPAKVQAFRDSVAGQMNDQSGGPRLEDLSDRIADIVITTSAQGAGTLEVHVIDPMWVLPQSGFITADANDFLLPIDVNFPTGTDCIWRLCQYRPSLSTSMDQANLILTFEDRIVSLLREISAGNGGVQQGQPNQTLAEFFQMLISSANTLLKPKPKIAFVPLIATDDPNATVQITQLPKNAEKKLKPTGLAAQLQTVLNNWSAYQLGAFPDPPGTSSTIAGLEQQITGNRHKLGAFPTPRSVSTGHPDPTNYAK